MRAMLLERQGEPLVLRDLPTPQPGPDQVLVDVEACGVCRTDLHVMDGDLTRPKLPLVMGHEVVGRVREVGLSVRGSRANAGVGAPASAGSGRRDSASEAGGDETMVLEAGMRVGIPWLGRTCGHCGFCRSGRENLCDQAGFTGYQIDGGYAECAVAQARYCFPIPEEYDPVEAAPLLCAGLIGYRSYRMAGEGRRLGLYGFGAAAHIIAQVAVHDGREVYAFTRPGDTEAQEFALGLGACWAGGSDEFPPQQLDAAILFAPVGALVPLALKAVTKGGIVVCAGIHMSPIPSFEYSLLWEERSIVSVANLTRQDGIEFFRIAPRVPVRTTVQPFPLEQANEALERLRSGKINGAAVLVLKE